MMPVLRRGNGRIEIPLRQVGRTPFGICRIGTISAKYAEKAVRTDRGTAGENRKTGKRGTGLAGYHRPKLEQSRRIGETQTGLQGVAAENRRKSQKGGTNADCAFRTREHRTGRLTIIQFIYQSFPSARLRQPGRGIIFYVAFLTNTFTSISPLLKTAVSPLYRSVRCLCRSPPYIARYGKAVPEQRQPASCRYMPELRLVETTRYSAP